MVVFQKYIIHIEYKVFYIQYVNLIINMDFRKLKAMLLIKRSRPKIYADIAILCMLTIKMVFRLPLRATRGLVESIIDLLHLSIEAADHTTLCRR